MVPRADFLEQYLSWALGGAGLPVADELVVGADVAKLHSRVDKALNSVLLSTGWKCGWNKKKLKL